MSKRAYNFSDNSSNTTTKKRYIIDTKHSLDSDEEDKHDDAEDEMNTDDIEGEEEGRSRQVEGIRMTAFNMKEELEEGHFDKQGHFIWNNEKEIRDNWLDNVDWHKVNDESKYNLDPDDKTLADDSSSDSESSTNNDNFNVIDIYDEMLKLMKPNETVNKTIRRLGGNQKLSSVERLKRKKAGTLNDNEDVTKMTEFANNVLTKTGNMNVYQETFEDIKKKIDNSRQTKTVEPALDMYSDDFEVKEKQKHANNQEKTDELLWEFKWDQNKDDIDGPHTTKQMLKWSKEGYFKTGVWARKCGEESHFYSSNRIDFELYE